MNYTPKISVIVPVYNVEKYLTECVESVLAQTFTDFELLLIDDGSKDSSGVICDEYAAKDNRIRVLHKENGGLSSARNVGIAMAMGEFVIFLDPDDYWIESNVLDKLISIAIGTKCDIVRGEYKEVDLLGNDLFVPKSSTMFYHLSGKKCSSIEFLHGPISQGNFVWLFLIKKDTLTDCIFNENQKYQEDIEFNIRYFSIPRVCVYIPLLFYAYRKRENSLTSSLKIENIKNSFMLCDVFYEYSKKTEDLETSIHYMNNAIMMYYWTLETISLSPLYQNRRIIIKTLELAERQKKIVLWINETQRRFPIVTYLPPYIAVGLFRIKNQLIKFLQIFKKILNK